MHEIPVWFFIIIFIAFVIWVFSWEVDRERITAYVQERGGRVVSIHWAPFGVGWFGERNDRIYEVVYYDQAGNQHFATCKTGFWSGVYWTEDRITHRKSKWYDSLSPSNEPGKPLIGQISEDDSDKEVELQSLREENARLRELIKERGRPPHDQS